MTLEERMAKELEGKFFWACKESSSESAWSREIREAQRKFRPPDKISPVPEEPVNDSLDAPKIKGRPSEIIDRLRTAICLVYGIPEAELTRHTNGLLVCTAKHHFYWALPNYLSHLSISEIARKIGKHHSSILHTRKKFDPNRKDLQKLISKVDEMMEKVLCG